MAFPTVAATATFGSTSNQTTHTVNLPASIAAGDLLVLAVTNDTDATQTTPADWTRITNTASSTLSRLCIYVKDATGSEGSTVDIVVSTSQGLSSAAYRIEGWYGDLAGQEVGVAVAANTSAPDPPSLTASWGAEDNLWIVVLGYDDEVNNINTWPTNYSSNQTNGESNHSNEGTGTALATYNLNTATQDPGAFAISGTSRTVANTVVIRPAAVGGDVFHEGLHKIHRGIGPVSAARLGGVLEY